MHKFAHIADCHIGHQTHPTLQKLELRALRVAMEKCVEEKVDFVLVSGDLFHVNIPDLSAVNESVKIMRDVRDHGIPIYVIYGSHDFSPNNASIIEVLASTGLLTKVVKVAEDPEKLKLEFTIDPKTGAKIAGISGRKRGIEKHYLEFLDRESLEREEGFKIFAFHSGIDELKPDFLSEMESMPISLLPKGFDYYAGGHVHKNIIEDVEGYGKVVYPGPLFAGHPQDMERTAKKGEERGFCIVEFDDKVRSVKFEKLHLCEFVYFPFDASNKNATQVQEDLAGKLNDLDVEGKVVIMKIKGELSAGKTSDINFTQLRKILGDNGAVFVGLNRYSLKSKEFASMNVAGENIQEIEEKLLQENIGNVKLSSKELMGERGYKLAKELLEELKDDQKFGESKGDYQARILQRAIEIMNLGE